MDSGISRCWPAGLLGFVLATALGCGAGSGEARLSGIYEGAQSETGGLETIRSIEFRPSGKAYISRKTTSKAGVVTFPEQALDYAVDGDRVVVGGTVYRLSADQATLSDTILTLRRK